jgi:putative acetyltransferase
VRIAVDELSGPQIAEFLDQHARQLRSVKPAGCKHVLGLDGLRQPGITVWSVRDGGAVVGCGAIARLDPGHAEIKSVRTSPDRRRTGVGSLLLSHLIGEARAMGFRRLSLETGAAEFFLPARKLYEKFGFEYCGPFAGYRPNPHDVFMTRSL